ncbi:MAG TPA: carotenoid biosynthesis protein [Gemmatimonadaceae bacterium]|nr:carotenoid biosynthesis protein [Gemmatimonadaceae bacterium]
MRILAPDITLAPARGTDRFATALLIAHVALIVFSTFALTTFLAGPPPAWLQSEESQAALRIGWKYSGPTYVVLGALAILAHAAARVGWARAFALLAAGFSISLAAELIGTSTGLPFGPYSYTTLLGWRVAGLVPFPIPLSWFYMLYASLAILGRVLEARDDARGRLRWAMAAGLVLTAWDVSMDPAMSYATPHWIWHVRGFFYGMPLLNWFGWWLTGSVVAFAMLSIVRPRAVAARVSPSQAPLLLYAVNGVFPIAICARHGLWWAAALGTLAMAVPLVLAVRARRAVGSRLVSLPPQPTLAGGD